MAPEPASENGGGFPNRCLGVNTYEMTPHKDRPVLGSQPHGGIRRYRTTRFVYWPNAL